jgi:hypothetical protein
MDGSDSPQMTLEGILDFPILDIGDLSDASRTYSFPPRSRGATTRREGWPPSAVDDERPGDELRAPKLTERAGQRDGQSVPDPPDAAVIISSDTDPFLEAVANSCHRMGMCTELLEHAEAGRYFSVRTTATGTTVTPYRAIYVNSRDHVLSATGTSLTPESREEDALLWAVLSWSNAPVVNRPGLSDQGPWHRQSTFMLRDRIGCSRPGVDSEENVVVSREHAWAIKAAATTAGGATAVAVGPSAAESSPAQCSVRLVRDLGLDLCIVSWAEGAGRRVPVALNAYPTAATLGPTSSAVAESVARILHGG